MVKVVECLIEGGRGVKAAHEEDGPYHNANNRVEHGQPGRQQRVPVKLGPGLKVPPSNSEADDGNQEGQSQNGAEERAERGTHA